MKMVCHFCREITECSCPDDSSHKHDDAKFVCETCLRMMDEGVPEAELKDSPMRKEIKEMMEAEEAGDALAEKCVEEFFVDAWTEAKGLTKEFSRKELAEHFFGMGLSIAFTTTLKASAEKSAEEAGKKDDGSKEEKGA